MKNWTVRVPRQMFLERDPPIKECFEGYHGVLFVYDDPTTFMTTGDKVIGGEHESDHQPSQLAVIQFVEMVRNFNERNNRG